MIKGFNLILGGSFEIQFFGNTYRYSFEALFAKSILYPCCGVISNLGHFWISAAAFFFVSKQKLCKKLEHVVSAFFRASLHPGQEL